MAIAVSRGRTLIPVMTCTIALFFTAASLVSCSRTDQTTGPVTYYVSTTGNDTAIGTSPSTAWRSLRRVNSVIFRPGDRLFLQGGQRFGGNITLDSRDAGNASRPVVVSSYGTGQATITASDSTGIAIYDTAGVRISNLSIVGTSKEPHSGAGINVYSDLRLNQKLDYISISDVSVSGFSNGIAVGAGIGATGFRNVSIRNASLHDNLDTGLQTYGPPFAGAHVYVNEDVNVSHVIAFHNFGDPKNHSYSTGSGIILASVKGGDISWSTAYDNGGAGIAPEGPEGIWAYDSTNVVIEHDISYGNRTSNRIDGNGFGLDENTSYSYLQYDLSYDNDGSGYLLYGHHRNGFQAHNVMRFSISYGNGADGDPRFGGIDIAGTVNSAAIYQNTVIAQSGQYGPAALTLGDEIHDILIQNNIFMTTASPVVFARVTSRAPTILLQGNDYYTSSPDWSVQWGRSDYASLGAWRSATSQETVAGKPVGLATDPEFSGPVLSLGLSIVTEARNGTALMLRPGSPLMGTGLDLSSLAGLPTMRDFSGDTVSARSPNVGAE